MLFSALNELPHRTRRAIQLRELDERSTEETARIMGISGGAVKARVFQGRRKLRARVKRYVESAWASGREASHTIGNTHMSPKIRSAAMRVVKAGTKGGSYGDVSVCRTIGALGLSVFHRPGRHCRSEASSLSRVRDDTISLGERVVGQSVLVQIGFLVVKEIQHSEKGKYDSEIYSGSSSWNSGDRPGSDGPGAKGPG